MCSGLGTLSPGKTDSGIDQFDTWSIAFPAIDMKADLTVILTMKRKSQLFGRHLMLKGGFDSNFDSVLN